LSFSLPYSRNRRYLTGIDWIVGLFDYTARRNIGLGGFSQAILEVEGRLDPQTIRSALDHLSKRFPLIHGRVARDWLNLAPYWKIEPTPAPIPLKVVELPAERGEEAVGLLDDHVNHPFDSRCEHLRCLLILVGGEKSFLGLVFDHRLLDAFGAEAIFRLMDLDQSGRLEEFAGQVEQTEPAHLDHWKRRLISGRTLNHYLFSLNEKTVSALAMPREGQRRRVHFLHDSLTAEETAAFAARAGAEIGVPVMLPSAAARAIDAMRRAVPNPALPGEQCLIFTTAASRLPGQEWEKLFFNRFALMAFTSANDSHPTVAELAMELRTQLFEQMRLQIPFVMEDAGALGRICPHWIGSRLMRSLFSGRLGSFYFACIRDCGYPENTFFGRRVVNLFHKPLVFAPPGLNLCITSYAGRFNLVVSFIEEAISKAAAAEFLAVFKKSLRE
jgi:hypothetical protein